MADFLSDWASILQSDLDYLGVKIAPRGDKSLVHYVEEVCLVYVNALKRLIPRRPRRVIRAPGFACPVEAQSGLDALLARFEDGDDVNPHRSTAVTASKRYQHADELLNHFGIHHFHLGLGQHPRDARFVERSDQLLFALLREQTVYFLSILPHEDDATGRKPWSMMGLFETIHENWPDEIAHLRLLGVTDVTGAIRSDEDVAAWRKSRINVLLETADGTIYTASESFLKHPSGFTLQDGMQADQWMNEIVQFQRHTGTNIDRVLAEIRRQGRTSAVPLMLRLRVNDEGEMGAVEPESGVVFASGRRILPARAGRVSA